MCSIPNLPDAESIRRLVQCIREVRFKKTSEGLKAIDGNPLKVNLLSFMELNEIRPFLLNALDKAAKLTALELAERAAILPDYASKEYTMMSEKTLDTQPNVYSETYSGEPYNPYAYSTT